MARFHGSTDDNNGVLYGGNDAGEGGGGGGGGGGVLEVAGTLVGRTVRKEFSFGILEGKVAYAHRPDGEALLLRVVRIFLERGQNCREAGTPRLKSTAFCFVSICFCSASGVSSWVNEISAPQVSLGVLSFGLESRFVSFCSQLSAYPPPPPVAAPVALLTIMPLFENACSVLI